MVGEGILYCCLSKRRNGAGLEPNINAGGCNFNSFLRRAVRFVGGCGESQREEMFFPIEMLYLITDIKSVRL